MPVPDLPETLYAAVYISELGGQKNKRSRSVITKSSMFAVGSSIGRGYASKTCLVTSTYHVVMTVFMENSRAKMARPILDPTLANAVDHVDAYGDECEIAVITIFPNVWVSGSLPNRESGPPAFEKMNFRLSVSDVGEIHSTYCCTSL